MKNTRPILLTLLLLVFTLQSFADEPETYGQQIGLKTTSSLANIFTCWFEIPKNIINVTNAKDSNIFYGLVGGTFKGTIVTIGRLTAGVTDLITFPIPTKPIAYPVYVWNDFYGDTSFGPIFQLYDRRPPTNNYQYTEPEVEEVVVEEPTVVIEGDDDGDGIINSQDKCPNTPTGAIVDNHGCWAYHGVFFDFDQDVIKPEFIPLFENAVYVLNQNPELTVEIQGHTDNIGDAEYNIKLSERRAQAVKDYLVENGISAERLTIRGLGMSDPAVSNDTEEGRAFNRRVYFERTDISE